MGSAHLMIWLFTWVQPRVPNRMMDGPHRGVVLVVIVPSPYIYKHGDHFVFHAELNSWFLWSLSNALHDKDGAEPVIIHLATDSPLFVAE